MTEADWRGPAPLPNPLEVARLGEIYSRTAAFYDEIVAERQAGPKLEALRQLNRKPGQSFTIKPGKGMDLNLSVGEVFREMPIHVTLNRWEHGSAKIGIVAHRELLIILMK